MGELVTSHYFAVKLLLKRVVPQLVWFSWLGVVQADRRVTGSILGQGTCLGCGLGPQLGRVWKVTNRCFSLALMFLSLSPSLPLSLKFKKKKKELGK